MTLVGMKVVGSYIDAAEVAKLVRKDLKEHFPAIKFSVRLDRYAGGSSINVDWTDGATRAAVEAVAGKYHGCDFDGMQDLETYNGRPYGNHYIFFNRNYSDAVYLNAAKKVMKDWGEQVNLEGTIDQVKCRLNSVRVKNADTWATDLIYRELNEAAF